MLLTIGRFLDRLRPYIVSSLLLSLLVLSPLTLADAKRVTVPIALPFQQQTASAATSSSPQNTTPPPQPLQTTQFTQTLAPSSSAASSQAPAAVATTQAPAATSVTTPAAIPQAASSAAAKPVAQLQQPPKPQSKPAPKPEPKPAPKAQAEPKPLAKPAPSTPVNSPTKAPTNAPVKVEPRAAAASIPLITTAPVKAPRYPVGHPEAFVAEFEDYVAKKIAPYVPGVAIVVVSGGQVKSLQSFGVRRAGTREKVTPDTIFRLASLTKPIAGTAASVLIHEGGITLDTPITQVLPNVSFSNARYAKQLTLRHALSQSSGLPRHTYSHFIDQNMNYAEVVRRLRYVNFVCPPGKCFAYQNVTFSLAGDMIQRKSGMSFESYVGKKVFAPLGMRSASFGLASYNASPNRATPHILSGNRWTPTNVVNNWYKVAPAAGANASIVDMSKFLLGQIGRRPDALPLPVLKTVQSRITPNTPAQNYYGVRKAVGNTAYGLGWRVFDYGRYKNFVHHGGHVRGFRTEMVFNRDLQIGMVFLTNSETRLARDVIFKFLDMHARAQQAARTAKPARPQ